MLSVIHFCLDCLWLFGFGVGRNPWPSWELLFLTSIVVLLSLGWMSRMTRVKSDSVQTLLYSTFFAAGIFLVSLGSSRVDLDAECVLFGEMAFLPLRPTWIVGGIAFPQSTVILGLVTLLTVLAVVLCYRVFLLTTFDESFSLVNGVKVHAVRFALLVLLSLVVAAAFESVGVILVVGMLILPGATLLLVPSSLRNLLWALPVYSIALSYAGVELAFYWDSSIGATMVFLAFVFFLVCVLFRHFGKNILARRALNQTLSIPQK